MFKRRVRIERGVLNLMDGGCQLPLGIYVDTEFWPWRPARFLKHGERCKSWNEQPVSIVFSSNRKVRKTFRIEL